MTKKQLMEDYNAGKCCIVDEHYWIGPKIYALYPNCREHTYRKHTIRFDTWLSIGVGRKDSGAVRGHTSGSTYYFNSKETKRFFQEEYPFIR